MAIATVFVSYSRADNPALEQLKRFVRPLERDGRIAYWDDMRIGIGSDWFAAIVTAIEQARVAILFISQSFLASEFIVQEEIPRILARAHAQELLVLPVFLSHSTVEDD